MKAEAKKLINTFYQPLGKLSCNVNSDIMWEHAKERALEICKMILEEYNCYSLSDARWNYWEKMEVEIKKL